MEETRMRWLIWTGALVVVGGYVLALVLRPVSAMQEIVQQLLFLQGTVGFVIIGLGLIGGRLEQLSFAGGQPVAPAPDGPGAAEIPQPIFGIGDGVSDRTRGLGTVVGYKGALIMVDFGGRQLGVQPHHLRRAP